MADVPSARRPEPRFVLDADLEAVAAAGSDAADRTVRLVGPYDPYLQLRDWELLVPEEARRKDPWRPLGAPAHRSRW